MYSGADILVGRLKFSESCQRYSNLLVRQLDLTLLSRLNTILICRFHFRTRLRGTELCDRAVEEVYLVVEVDNCKESNY